MKNSNNQIVYTNYHHQGIDTYLADWKQNTSALVQQKAKTNAGKKLPKASGDDFRRYIGFFKEKVQECIRDIDRILKITPVLFSIKQLKDKRDDIVFKLQGKKEELESKLLNLRPDANHSENKLVRTGSMLLILILILLGSAEAFLSYKPFLYITGNMMASVVICIVFAILWMVGAEKFASYWNNGEGAKKYLKRLAMVLGCTVIFYAIAHLRAIEKACSRAILNDEPIPGFFNVNYFEVLVLTCVGWLFFIGGVWIAQRSPSILQLKEAIIQKINRRTAKKVKFEIVSLESQINTENDRISREEHAALSLMNIRKQAIREVAGHLTYLIEEYKEVNYSCRVDGVYPDCFNEKITFDLDTMVPNIKEDIDHQLQNITA